MDKPGWWPKNAEECYLCPELDEDTGACSVGDNYCERDMLAVARALVEHLQEGCEAVETTTHDDEKWLMIPWLHWQQIRKAVGLDW